MLTFRAVTALLSVHWHLRTTVLTESHNSPPVRYGLAIISRKKRGKIVKPEEWRWTRDKYLLLKRLIEAVNPTNEVTATETTKRLPSRGRITIIKILLSFHPLHSTKSDSAAQWKYPVATTKLSTMSKSLGHLALHSIPVRRTPIRLFAKERFIDQT
jgi:hypothetical protein